MERRPPREAPLLQRQIPRVVKSVLPEDGARREVLMERCCVRGSGLAFRVSVCFGLRVLEFGFRNSGFRFGDSGFGFRNSGFELRVQTRVLPAGCAGIQTPMVQGRSTKIISMIRWIRTSRLTIQNSLSLLERGEGGQASSDRLQWM